MTAIRDERPGDSPAIHHVVASAFGRYAEADLVDHLRAAGDCVLSLVAEQEKQIVGHVLLSRMKAPFPALALAPVSVIPCSQRHGIGSALITASITRARGEGWAAVFVLGDPHFYQRFGFDANAAAGFTCPYAGPHFMILWLTPTFIASTGELHHARAFAALD